MRNRTVSIPDELIGEMEKLREVNWSEVARQGFRKKLSEIEKQKELENDLQPIIERLLREKNEKTSN